MREKEKGTSATCFLFRVSFDTLEVLRGRAFAAKSEPLGKPVDNNVADHKAETGNSPVSAFNMVIVYKLLEIAGDINVFRARTA